MAWFAIVNRWDERFCSGCYDLFMRQWKHSPMKVQCASCGMEGLMANSKDKEWVNVGGRWYCSKQLCQQMSHMPLVRHKMSAMPRG